jgi:HK97 family phage major capsid protein
MSGSIAEKYEVKSTELLAILAEGKTDKPDVIDLDKITRLSGSKAEKVEEIKKRRTEVEMLGYQVDAFNAQKIAQEAKERSQNPVDDQTLFGAKGEQTASAADLYLKSAIYQSEGHGFGSTLELKLNAKDWVHSTEQKTIMTTAAGWATRPLRVAELTTQIAARPIQVTDLIPSSNTDQSAILFMEETTRTNAAVEIGEGVTYPESASAFTERTSTVRKIGTSLPVTDEQLDDVPQVRTFLDELLPFMVRQRLDSEIFNGNGTPPNLTGLLSVGSIQTQARGADPIPTAFLKAMVKLRITGRVVPSGILIHPTDWQSVKTLQTTTGEYIWGHPSVVGPDTMWGLPMAQVDAGSAGTAVVADFLNYTRLYYRNGPSGVEVGYVNDDFRLGQKTLRADVRAAFVVRRAAAICSVTGL